MRKAQVITRFAPSPTGRLHKGNAYSAVMAYQFALMHKGRFILRIEDIDTGRCRDEFVDGIYEDLRWLGLTWQQPVRVQSQHFDNYEKALYRLKALGVVYPCFCTRKDIQKEMQNSSQAPHNSQGFLYPKTCTHLTETEIGQKVDAGIAYAWRLNMDKAIAYLKAEKKWPLVWHDRKQGEQTANPATFGDIILARKDTPTSYHLSVTVDDALQGITHVIRGMDLFDATHIHVLLQALLGLPTPRYYHHQLLLDDSGNRFAKRDKSVTLQSLRCSGKQAGELLAELSITS